MQGIPGARLPRSVGLGIRNSGTNLVPDVPVSVPTSADIRVGVNLRVQVLGLQHRAVDSWAGGLGRAPPESNRGAARKRKGDLTALAVSVAIETSIAVSHVLGYKGTD